MKISVSAMMCFLLLAVCCGTTLAQNLGTYRGIVTTTFNNQSIPAQETTVTLDTPLQDTSGTDNPCGSSSPESNPFNLKVEPSFLLGRPGEIQIDSAATLVRPTSSTVLQYWCICNYTRQEKCEACYPDENMPPRLPFPPGAIRGCLVETHENVANLPNLLIAPQSGGFVTPVVIQKSAILTGTIDEGKQLLMLTIKGMTVLGDDFTTVIKDFTTVIKADTLSQ